MSGPRRVYVDQPVEQMAAPDIYIRPVNRPLMSQTILFIPFRISQAMEKTDLLEMELSRVFWRTWLAAGVSPVLAFDENGAWNGRQDAVERARAAGADLVAGGEITYLMFGGTEGRTAVSLRLSVIDAASGELLWSMAHAGQMQPGPTRDFVFFTQRSRMPADPTYAVMTTLAHETALPVRDWNRPAPEPEQEESAEEQPAPAPLG
jgi:hypothetical protein